MSTEILEKLSAAAANRIVQAMEAMTGVTFACDVIPADRPPEIPADALLWNVEFNQGPAACLRVAAAAETWKSIGRTVLEAAGIDTLDDPTLESTYAETLAQVGSAITQDLNAISKSKWEVTASGLGGSWTGSDPSWSCRLQLSGGSVLLYLQASQKMLDAISGAPVPPPPASNSPLQREELPPATQFDLLLDVDLPVSVSFGRALVQLKDILKLNSGSIVELNRAVTEPVEVIVNNCVIAKGEVVVVEGNYGVRIQQIISRQDRLRTMH
jgi:flagellar motor switch protein FliN/FliY